MTLIEQIIAKHKSDREVIKQMKARHAEELRTIEEFQAKREAALIERAGVEAFSYMVDLFINGRDGKAEVKKQEANISMDQAKIESWLLKMLNQVGAGIKTEFGTVYKTRKEGVSVADFDMFVEENMLKSAAQAVIIALEEGGVQFPADYDLNFVSVIKHHMHLEYLNKAVNKTAILELMGDAAKDGSRPNPPPAGVNYTAIQTVGVRKPTK